MTSLDARRWRLGILATLLTALLLKVATVAWASKVDTPVFQSHVRDAELTVVRDSSWKDQQQKMTLEILCTLKEADRRCR